MNNMKYSKYQKVKKIYWWICTKYFLLSIIYLLLYFICIFMSNRYDYILFNHIQFNFLFMMENNIILEICLFFIINGIIALVIHKVINKVLLQNIYTSLFTLIFVSNLVLSYITLIYDIILSNL